MSEVSRLQIVCSLKTGAKNVSEIVEETGLGQANVSKHLNMLTQAGIVAREQKGICVYYEIANPFLFELCDLVCDALSAQFQQQSQQLEMLKTGASRRLIVPNYLLFTISSSFKIFINSGLNSYSC